MTDFSASVDDAEIGHCAVIEDLSGQAAVGVDGRAAFILGDGRTASVMAELDLTDGAFGDAFSSAFNL